MALSLDEADKEALLGLLRQHLARNPEHLDAYDALINLSEKRVVGAAELLFRLIEEVSKDSIPAAVAPKVLLLGKGDPSLMKPVNKLLMDLGNNHPKTVIGRAAKAELE
jgi:hypothetical protein